MTVAELIAALSEHPPYYDVSLSMEIQYYEESDEEMRPVESIVRRATPLHGPLVEVVIS